MKRIKKIMACLLVAVMALAMGVTVWADDEPKTVNITINDGTEVSGSTYVAYKLMDATVSSDGTKYAYTLNSKYSVILKDVTEKTKDSEVVEYLNAFNELENDNDETKASKKESMRTFADAVYGEIEKNSILADKTASNGKFENLAQGYYLIAESETGTRTDGNSDTYSLVMLDTAGNSDLTVYTKEDTVTLEKK